MSKYILTSLIAFAGTIPTGRAQEVLLPDFEISTFADGLRQPGAMEFAPDGRLFVAEKGGAIRVIEDGRLREEPFAQLAVYDFSECGLLGLALDSEFARTGHVFLFATVSSSEQQILRLTDEGNVGVELTVIADNLPTSGQNHNGGCLRVGPDRHLYFSIGDVGIPERSQDMRTLAGKLARLRLDGSVPDDNPFATPTGTPRAIYALGFRNPFRFCFAPDGTLYVMDVGSNDDVRREEINLVARGQNFGWPLFEGAGDGSNADVVDPILAYHDEGASIAGCAVYAGSAFPSTYVDNLFHLDFVSQSLFRLARAADGTIQHSRVALLDGGPVDLTEGPDGALYVAGLFSGRIDRLAYLHAPEPELDDDSGDQPDTPNDMTGADDVTGPVPRLCGVSWFGAAASVLFGLLTLRFLSGRTVRRSP